VISLSIVTVLEHYGASLSGTPSAGWHPLRCPFHDDHMASAGVNIQLNGFRCHACDISGDAIKVIEMQEHMNYGEAVDFARKVLGASIETISRPVPKRRKRRKLGRERWKKILE
jgi:DNA primase